jgi:hypothetical protein
MQIKRVQRDTNRRVAGRFEVDQITLFIPTFNGNRERISGAMQLRRRERQC